MSQEVLGILEGQIKPEHTALVVIDPQNDFCANDGAMARLMEFDVSRIQRAVGPLHSFIQKARNPHFSLQPTMALFTHKNKKNENKRVASSLLTNEK